ncbi:hypothetical protein RRG08_065934 [Elysia crispata]|uniref:Protein YIPF n=1 Tax=Elysia crispata TaxID=231223 RepID=A0AAE0ZGA2_9GAST|nr:hypothetical protein RRG08_065934 [Elysia crispata]
MASELKDEHGASSSVRAGQVTLFKASQTLLLNVLNFLSKSYSGVPQRDVTICCSLLTAQLPDNTTSGTGLPGEYVTPFGSQHDASLSMIIFLGRDHAMALETMAVLNPLKSADHTIMQDTDLAGPLVFCMAFGGSLLLSGKLHFGYIYGIGLVGCLAMYCLLNLMSLSGVSAGIIVSVLGYCLLPMVFLSFSAVLLSLKGMVGIVLVAVTVLWCSVSASKLFVSALAMDSQQLLVAYPCTLVYGVFALLTVF